MWFKTRAVILTSGLGAGSSRIVAFDAALRSAKIADFNLIQVSSIVPPGVPVYVFKEGVGVISGDGCMLPTVYATSSSQRPGEVLSGAVGLGVPTDSQRSGVIFFNQGHDLAENDCISELEAMVAEGMKMLRRTDAYTYHYATASQQVEDSNEWRSVVAALSFVDDHMWKYFEDAVEPVSGAASRPPELVKP